MKDRIEEERQYLEKVKKRIEEERVYQIKEFEEIPHKYKGRYAEVKWGDEDLVEHLQDMIIKRLAKLKNLPNNPYFGRIDFLREDQNEVDKIYVGKTTITDKNNNILTTDWRTPVCTLYYDQSIGPVQYEAPQGAIKGNLDLKSQIIIKDGELVSVRDTDLVTDDELLVPFLTTNADSRLKNIVASIQAEQNGIIRRPLNDNLIVQGVAGSGKTTVALHRAAYLIYNEDKYDASNFMIIGPNKYFLNYISGLLPDLDTENISQFTYEDFTQFYLESSKITINNENKNIVNPELKYKTTLNYRDAIDNYTQDFVGQVVGNGFCVEGYSLFSRETIMQYFERKNPLSVSATNIQKLLKEKIKDNYESIYDRISQEIKEKVKSFPQNSPLREETFNKLTKIKEQLKRGCNKELGNYFKPFKANTLNFYKNFISNSDKYLDLNERSRLMLQKETLISIKKKEFTFEELPALLHIEMRLNGDNNEELKKYVHVIVDEAQDYGMFHYDILKRMFTNSSFSIFGDIAQSIYPNRGVEKWEEVNQCIFKENAEVLYLDKCYRTTIEITTNANHVLEHLDLKLADPVIRTGDGVNFQEANLNESPSVLTDLLYEYAKEDFKSVGIICKDEQQIPKIKSLLDYEGIASTSINNDDSEYKGGICVLTSHLSKGLEFDAVIITDGSEKEYSSSNVNDMKLLYVATTRPLHRLDILYSDELTKPMQYIKNKEKPSKDTNTCQVLTK